jgi:hypothetical protein
MKYCVFIPSIPKRFDKLENLVDIYNVGTVKPDEIIINASEVNNENYIILIDLFNKKIDNLKIIPHQIHLDAGTNRQQALYISTSNIIIYQDDDDLPSNNRVEIIKWFFENKDIVCLNHSYVYNEGLKIDPNGLNINNINIIESDNIYKKYFPNNKLEDCKSINSYGEGFGFPVCAGACSIKKEILKQVEWKNNDLISLCKFAPKGEDFDFCMDVLFRFNKSIMIDSKLYSYLK